MVHEQGSGGSRIFERGVQVQADYGNSTVLSRQASMSMQRLRSRCPSARSAEKFGNLGPLRSHLVAFQALYSKHWSGGRRNCRICFTPLRGW